MICYAVLDTNVLVSALLSGKDDAATVQVLGKAIAGEIIPVYSSFLLLSGLRRRYDDACIK